MIQQGNTGFDLAIKNNFFDKETYNKICEDGKEQKTLTKNIDLQGDLAKKIIKNVDKYFNYKIKKISSLMTTLTANSPLFSPHVDLSDDTKAQIIVFILGKKDKNSGTGFYLQENFRSKNTAPIDIVGFHDNKCIFFNSSMPHAPTHNSEEQGLWRYSLLCSFK